MFVMIGLVFAIVGVLILCGKLLSLVQTVNRVAGREKGEMGSTARDLGLLLTITGGDLILIFLTAFLATNIVSDFLALLLPAILIFFLRRLFRKKRMVTTVATALLLIMLLPMAGMFGNYFAQSKVTLGTAEVKFSTPSSFSAAYTAIDEIELLEEMPALESWVSRQVVFGEKKKGVAKLRGYGAVHLYIDGQGPYLYIKLNSGDQVLMSSANAQGTQILFEDIQKKLEK